MVSDRIMAPSSVFTNKQMSILKSAKSLGIIGKSQFVKTKGNESKHLTNGVQHSKIHPKINGSAVAKQSKKSTLAPNNSPKTVLVSGVVTQKINISQTSPSKNTDIINHLVCKKISRPVERARTFLCKYCCQKFPDPVMLDGHQKSHGDHPIHACHICGFVASTFSSLMSHFVKHSAGRPTDNKVEKTKLSSKEKTTKVSTKPANISCTHCKQVFNKKETFNSHYCPELNKKTEILCTYCREVTHSVEEYRDHIQSHALPQFICHPCGTRFSKKAQFNDHINTCPKRKVAKRCLSNTSPAKNKKKPKLIQTPVLENQDEKVVNEQDFISKDKIADTTIQFPTEKENSDSPDSSAKNAASDIPTKEDTLESLTVPVEKSQVTSDTKQLVKKRRKRQLVEDPDVQLEPRTTRPLRTVRAQPRYTVDLNTTYQPTRRSARLGSRKKISFSDEGDISDSEITVENVIEENMPNDDVTVVEETKQNEESEETIDEIINEINRNIANESNNEVEQENCKEIAKENISENNGTVVEKNVEATTKAVKITKRISKVKKKKPEWVKNPNEDTADETIKITKGISKIKKKLMWTMNPDRDSTEEAIKITKGTRKVRKKESQWAKNLDENITEEAVKITKDISKVEKKELEWTKNPDEDITQEAVKIIKDVSKVKIKEPEWAKNPDENITEEAVKIIQDVSEVKIKEPEQEKGLNEEEAVKKINCKSQNGTLFCQVCSLLFRSMGSLRRHKKMHTGKPQFLCQFCGKFFFRRDIHLRHENSVHQNSADKGFNCYYCKQEFESSELLKEHSSEAHATKALVPERIRRCTGVTKSKKLTTPTKVMEIKTELQDILEICHTDDFPNEVESKTTVDDTTEMKCDIQVSESSDLCNHSDVLNIKPDSTNITVLKDECTPDFVSNRTKSIHDISETYLTDSKDTVFNVSLQNENAASTCLPKSQSHQSPNDVKAFRMPLQNYQPQTTCKLCSKELPDGQDEPCCSGVTHKAVEWYQCLVCAFSGTKVQIQEHMFSHTYRVGTVVVNEEDDDDCDNVRTYLPLFTEVLDVPEQYDESKGLISVDVDSRWLNRENDDDSPSTLMEQVRCAKCSEIIIDLELLIEHPCLESDNDSYVCFVEGCWFITNNKRSLQSHLGQKHFTSLYESVFPKNVHDEVLEEKRNKVKPVIEMSEIENIFIDSSMMETEFC